MVLNGYTILQYESKDNTESAFTELENEGIEVFVDSVLNAPTLAIEGYDDYVDNGVKLLGLDALQNNIEYNSSADPIYVAVLDTGISEDSIIYDRVYAQVDYSTSEGEETTITSKHGEKVAGIIADSTSDNVKIVERCTIFGGSFNSSRERLRLVASVTVLSSKEPR